MLHLNTIDSTLFKVLVDFSRLPELSNFYLVGGTSLSLQLGHRKSDDLDFFTDRSFDIREVKDAILRYNPKVMFLNETRQGLSFSLPLSSNEDDVRKLDVYNWAVKFIRPARLEAEIRLASLEDIAAFKLEAICHRKEKKDYIDIAILLDNFSFGQMLDFYVEKFPMNDKRIVLTQILDTEGLDSSVDPVMLIDLNIKQTLDKIKQQVAAYSKAQIQAKDSAALDRAKNLADIHKKAVQKKKGRSL
jgi:hypothetical protein